MRTSRVISADVSPYHSVKHEYKGQDAFIASSLQSRTLNDRHPPTPIRIMMFSNRFLVAFISVFALTLPVIAVGADRVLLTSREGNLTPPPVVKCVNDGRIGQQRFTKLCTPAKYIGTGSSDSCAQFGGKYYLCVPEGGSVGCWYTTRPTSTIGGECFSG